MNHDGLTTQVVISTRNDIARKNTRKCHRLSTFVTQCTQDGHAPRSVQVRASRVSFTGRARTTKHRRRIIKGLICFGLSETATPDRR